jgi:hypothetical protein
MMLLKFSIGHARLPAPLSGALVACLGGLALLAPSAGAELVGEFNARVKNIKLSYGAYTGVFESRVYETNGTPTPELDYAEIHFPRGGSIRPQFLKGKYFCDTAKLEETASPSVCASSRIGFGGILLDARPDVADAIPSDLFLFLTKARQPGATASVAVLVLSNQRTPVYASQVLYGTLSRDSGKYGYKLQLPTAIEPLVPGLHLALAELKLTVTGLTQSRRGKKLFWTKLPKCIGKRKVTFGADYRFRNATTITRTRTVGCKRFLRNPSTHGRGEIPR